MKESAMTFGKKIREARKQNGLSQEELAKKLCVSRPAITKWESDRGMPDIENLKLISKLLDVSIDYLVADSDIAVSNVLKQQINLDKYPKAKGNELKEDYVILEHYPNAEHIWQLSWNRKLSIKEKALDFIAPSVQYTADHWNDPSIYYLVDEKDNQFFMNVSMDFIISQRLTRFISDNSFEIGEQIFTKIFHKVR